MFVLLVHIYITPEEIEPQDDLVALQKAWFNLHHALLLAEEIFEWLELYYGFTCDGIPFPAGKAGCKTALGVFVIIARTIVFYLRFAYEWLDRRFESETLGPDQEYYS